ncbi:uncharacterized protein TNCT_36741 [Trichonephila clavata]|uniref:Uncharacterized protein n=1 Tax=Trichonephila clavata TaxID=2740835 RepID=A0A8X6F3U5_TRICU|nr:uncharacterized protein TNCT_36741 [Trichonephila clavata]
MKPGYRYNVNIRLEKEHLLPSPYQTNCTDYVATWKNNNKTGPRSQQMCRDICEQNFSNLCYGCEKGLKMFEKIENMCSPLEIYALYTFLKDYSNSKEFDEYFWGEVDHKKKVCGKIVLCNICQKNVDQVIERDEAKKDLEKHT